MLWPTKTSSLLTKFQQFQNVEHSVYELRPESGLFSAISRARTVWNKQIQGCRFSYMWSDVNLQVALSWYISFKMRNIVFKQHLGGENVLFCVQKFVKNVKEPSQSLSDKQTSLFVRPRWILTIPTRHRESNSADDTPGLHLFFAKYKIRDVPGLHFVIGLLIRKRCGV